MSDDLAPCPFCGGDAEQMDFEAVGSELGGDPNAGGSCICCKQCGASSAVHFDRKENLISSWNDRKDTDLSDNSNDAPLTLMKERGVFTVEALRELEAAERERDLLREHNAELTAACNRAGVESLRIANAREAWKSRAVNAEARIAELEKIKKILHDGVDFRESELCRKGQRIASLEAAVGKLREVADRFVSIYNIKFDGNTRTIAKWDPIYEEFDAASEKAIEEAAKKIFAHRGPEHREWGDFTYEQSEYRTCAKSALDAAAAVDGDAKWNAAIEAAANMAEGARSGIPKLGIYEEGRADAAAAIRSLKRLK